MDLKLCVPCLLGLEGIVSDELKRMDMKDVRAENGRVLFSGGEYEIAKANICLRSGERVLIELASFKAITFEELFQGVASIQWGDFIPADGIFPVKGHCLDSTLMSVPSCQSIIKKAAADKLKKAYGLQWMGESGSKYQIQFTIMKDQVSIYLDTTGPGLYKRGYRLKGNAAPLKETLAAAMVSISRYRGREFFADPFCGSGTIAIEAALRARNRAPGINRLFDSSKWNIPQKVWDDARFEAKSGEFFGDYEIWASDIDPESVEIAKDNAKRAGVLKDIRFKVADAAEFATDRAGGIIVTNPPYGQRIMEKDQAEQIYRQFGKTALNLNSWNIYILSSHTEFERSFGKKADKKRKLYNGMIKCDLFMYLNNIRRGR